MLFCSSLGRCLLSLFHPLLGQLLFLFLPSQRLAEWEGEEKTKQGSGYHDDAGRDFYLSQPYDRTGDGACYETGSSEDGTGCTCILALGIKSGGGKSWAPCSTAP